MTYLSDVILPPGATHRIHNRLFKIGAHDLVYKWSQDYQEWLRCNFEIEDLIGFEIRPSRSSRYV